MTRINRKHRRGLSSVVGAVFMILVMLGALNVILLAMQQQDRVTQAVVEKSNSSLSKLNEEISISEIKVTADNKLDMTVTNSGGATAKLASLYVVNETAKEQFRYDLNNVPVDGRASRNIDDLALTVKSNTKYSVKIVTEAGNTATSGITPISSASLPMSLYVIPPTVPPGNNVTLLFSVTNNITESNLAWDVSPTMVPYCDGCTLTEKEAPSGTFIGKGNTALFKWTYHLTSPDQLEHEMTFNASLANAKQGNFVIEKGLAKMVDSAQVSYQSEIIIANELIQKPEIFLIIPGPFGESSQLGLWGVVVINPTDQPMTVTRVVLNTYSSHGTANMKMIDSSQCDVSGPSIELVQIFPTSGWSCPHNNMIEWRDVVNPIEIQGYSIETFRFRYLPGSLTSGPESAFMISVGAFTSLGQFTKTGFSSSMDDSTQPLGNVYLTDTTNTADAVQNSRMLGHVNGILHNSTIRLNVTVADLDTSTSTQIKNGTRLIINVPRGFTDVVPDQAQSTGFYFGVNEPKVIPYGDGTIQIVAIMDGALGDTATEAKILSFTAKTPIVNGTKVYVMHTFVDGETSTNWSVGPLAQIALQIYKP